jgi:hypothetical protein
VTIPDNIKSIEEGAFLDCRNLTSVTIPNSVTRIGSCAFQGCKDLTSVTISKRCRISENSFPENCKIIKK